MYEFLLNTHGILRWVVVISGFLLVVKILLSKLAKNEYVKTDDKLSLYYIISLDVQLIIGILLYVVFSPITDYAFGNMGEAMKTSAVRFFVIEHTLMMIIGIALAHIGRVRVKKAADSAAKLKNGLIFYAISFLIILASIPWPFYSFGRDLF